MGGLWLWVPWLGPIRYSTLLAALVLLAVITLRRGDPWRAVVAMFAWLSLFETVYDLVGIVGFGWAAGNVIWVTAAVAGWIVLAAVLGIWPDWRIIAVFAALMAVWAATGFHSNLAGGNTPVDILSEMLNEAAKSTLALAYLVGALSPAAAPRATSLPSAVP